MSKMSVFKFSINNDQQTVSIINQIMNSYLGSRGFAYDSMLNCFATGNSTQRSDAANMALSVGASALTSAVTGGTAIAFYNVRRGLEYYIDNNVLTIKAFLITKDGRQMIHSVLNNSKAGAMYLGDLKGGLFKALRDNGISTYVTVTEQINDGSEAKALKVIFIVFGIVILFIVAMFFLITSG